MKKFDAKKLNMMPISGLKLRPYFESFLNYGSSKLATIVSKNENVIEMEILELILGWPDKAATEEIFFNNCSLVDYGKLSQEEVQERIINDFGFPALTEAYFACWIEYLGEQLKGHVDQKN